MDEDVIDARLFNEPDHNHPANPSFWHYDSTLYKPIDEETTASVSPGEPSRGTKQSDNGNDITDTNTIVVPQQLSVFKRTTI
jgi:hypothetical protein